jgi:competence protein ComEA
MWDFTHRQRLAAYVLLTALAVGGIVLAARRVRRPPIVIYPGPSIGDTDGSLSGDHAGHSVSSEPEEELEHVVVHVCGAVTNPGVYTLSKDARIADAVTLAGGLQDTAMEESVNMAMRVTDSMQIYIPGMSSPSVSATDEAHVFMSSPNAGKVNINTATVGELQELRGIGPTLADRIVEFRTLNGRFECPEDLMRVSGIGKKKYADLEDSITVY